MMLSDVYLSDVSLSHTSGISRVERPRKTKFGTQVAHITRDSDTTSKVKRSTCLMGFQAYACAHILLGFALH